MNMCTNSAIFTARTRTYTHLKERGREEFIDIQKHIINKGTKSEHITCDTRTYALVSLK